LDKKTDLKIFGQKRSCIKKFTYKRPLIVIVGP